jgi:hypothetical protein
MNEINNEQIVGNGLPWRDLTQGAPTVSQRALAQLLNCAERMETQAAQLFRSSIMRAGDEKLCRFTAAGGAPRNPANSFPKASTSP